MIFCIECYENFMNLGQQSMKNMFITLFPVLINKDQLWREHITWLKKLQKGNILIIKEDNKHGHIEHLDAQWEEKMSLYE